MNQLDGSRKLIESKEFDERGKLIGKKTSGLDSLGSEALTTYKKVNDMFMKSAKAVFYEGNNRIDQYTFSNGILISRERHTLDGKGNLIETIQDDPIRNEQRTTRYTYDEHNNKIGVVALKSNLIISKVIIKYDLPDTSQLSYARK